MATIIIALVISSAVCLALMPFVILLAKDFDIKDRQEGRQSFGGIKLRLGGLAVAAAFLYTIWLLLPNSKLILSLFVGGLFIVLIGVLDDIKGIKPYNKLILIYIASSIPVFLGIKLEWISIFGNVIQFGRWSALITVLWIVILTNAMNLIDGLDGLAGGIAVISSVTILVAAIIMKQPDIAIMSAGLCGACAGFLPFNLNKKSNITLGDTGALFIGFTFAVISIDGLFKFSTVVSYLIPAVLFSLPLSDVLISVIRRKREGKSIVQGDREHLHYRIAKMLGAQKAVMVLLLLTVINAVGAVLIAMGMTVPGIATVGLTAVISGVLYKKTKRKI